MWALFSEYSDMLRLYKPVSDLLEILAHRLNRTEYVI